MGEEEYISREIMLNRFNRLLADLMRGNVTRNTFQPWEVEILLDLETCRLDRRRRTEILQQYQRAVTRQMQTESGPPMKLSRFLELREQRREAMRRAAAMSEPPAAPECGTAR